MRPLWGFFQLTSSVDTGKSNNRNEYIRLDLFASLLLCAASCSPGSITVYWMERFCVDQGWSCLRFLARSLHSLQKWRNFSMWPTWQGQLVFSGPRTVLRAFSLMLNSCSTCFLNVPWSLSRDTYVMFQMLYIAQLSSDIFWNIPLPELTEDNNLFWNCLFHTRAETMRDKCN